MIKIKNTNNYETPIRCNGVEINLQPQTIIEVNEIVLGSLPKGVVKYTEEILLTEIDPYTDKTVKETIIDTSQLLTETN